MEQSKPWANPTPAEPKSGGHDRHNLRIHTLDPHAPT